MPPKRPSPPPPASPDEAATFSDDDDISIPSSPSLSPEASSDSDASSSEVSETDGAKKPRSPGRTWTPADDIALLEAVAAHRKMHGRLPSPGDLVAALRGRLQTDAQQIFRRVNALRVRYGGAARRLSHGIVPVKDVDLKIYRLSKLIWEATRRGKMKPRVSSAHQERRELGELEALYPLLAAEVEAIEARRPCAAAGLLRRAFGRIGDEKATELEAKAKKQRLAELKVSTQLGNLRNQVADMLLESIK